MMNRVNQQFGNYRLVNFLGQGGFAEVYLGRHMHMGSFAAIKILNAQLIATDSQRFLQEARLLVDLKHPHIVSVKECGIENGIPYLVMDYAPNGTLRQRHPTGTRVPLAQVVSYVLQVADALQYAHDRRLIHRDVKPENMLLGGNGEVLLSDFGIAVISASSSVRYTKDSAGTAIYMAPEQINRQAHPASDQYALGIVAYEWLCGEVPFQGSFGEITAKHLHARPPSFGEKNVNVPPVVEGIVMRVLAKRPEERFLTVKEFALALQSSSPQQMTYGSKRDNLRDGSLILAGPEQPSPYTVHPMVQQQLPTPANTPPFPRSTPHITRQVEPSTPGVPSPQLAPNIYPYNPPYAPTQPAPQYLQPRRAGSPCLVATLISVVLLLVIVIGAVFAVSKILTGTNLPSVTNTPEQLIDDFCQNLMFGDYQSAYEKYSKHLQARVLFPDFVNYWSANNETYYHIDRCDHQTIPTPSGSSITASWSTHEFYSSQIQSYRVTFIVQGNEWKVDQIASA